MLGELHHLHTDVIELTRLVRLDLGVDMTTNEDLAGVKANLTEATGEINSKIDELVAAAGDAADPALVAEIKSLSQGLADIVPNAPAEPEPTPEPEPEAPVDETPIADEPA